MARISGRGAELNTIADVEWNDDVNEAGMLALSTTTVRSGTYSLRVQSDGTNRGYFAINFLSSDTDINYYFRTYIYIVAYPSTGELNIIDLYGGGHRASIKLQTDGSLKLRNNGTQVGSNSAVLATGTWHPVELHYNSTNAAGADVLEGRLNESIFATSSSQSLAPVSLLVYGNGFGTASSGADVYFDDAAFNDASGSFQNSWPGVGEIIHLRPNAAGDNSGWSNDYTAVDEVTPDDVTTICESTTLNATDDHNLDATPATLAADDVVNCVQVGVRFRADGTSEPTIVLRIKASASGTVEESAGFTTPNTSWHTHKSSTYAKVYNLTLYDLPGASTTAWTKADLDTAQIGYRISVDATNNIEVTTVWLLVDHKPAAGVTTRRYTLPLLGVG